MNSELLALETLAPGIPDKVGADSARVILIQSGISRLALARSCGVTKRTVDQWFSNGFRDVRARWAFEAAVDYRAPIWSRPNELRLRRQCRRLLGFDPYLATRAFLIMRGAELGVPIQTQRSARQIRRAWITWLESHEQERTDENERKA